MASGMTAARCSNAFRFQAVAGHATSMTCTGIAATDEIVGAVANATAAWTESLSLCTAAANAITVSSTTAVTGAQGVLVAYNKLSEGGISATKIKSAVVAGADVSTNIAVTGILTTDTLLGVIAVTATTAALTDKLAVTSITSDGNIQLAAASGDMTGNKLIVYWNDNTGAGYSAACVKAITVTGANANTNIAISGIATDDVIASAILWAAAGDWSDITSTGSVTSAGNIQFTGSTASAKVFVIWYDTSE